MFSQPLKYEEYKPFIDLLCDRGNVLNLSKADFNALTFSTVGIRLTEHYNTSKEKSLRAYLESKDRNNSLKLLQAIMNEWDRDQKPHANKAEQDLATSCHKLLKEMLKQTPEDEIWERLKNSGFDSIYLNEQRLLILEKASSHPTASIGIAKELVESCCKTILEETGIEYNKNGSLPKLAKETLKAIGVNPPEAGEHISEPEAIKSLIGNLTAITYNLADLRNHHGTGHGKSASYNALSERHARLAIGSAFTLVDYLWATHKEQTISYM